MGKALARGFAAKGHDVKMGSRSPAKLAEFAKGVAGKVSTGTFEETAAHGEVVVVATLGAAAEEAVGLAGAKNFDGKVVIDVSNPLDLSKGMPSTNFLFFVSLRVVRAFVLGNRGKPDNVDARGTTA